jgi:hypothetical protein
LGGFSFPFETPSFGNGTSEQKRKRKKAMTTPVTTSSAVSAIAEIALKRRFAKAIPPFSPFEKGGRSELFRPSLVGDSFETEKIHTHSTHNNKTIQHDSRGGHVVVPSAQSRA